MVECESIDATCIKAGEGAWRPETDGWGATREQEVSTVTHPGFLVKVWTSTLHSATGFRLDHSPHQLSQNQIYWSLRSRWEEGTWSSRAHMTQTYSPVCWQEVHNYIQGSVSAESTIPKLARPHGQRQSTQTKPLSRAENAVHRDKPTSPTLWSSSQYSDNAVWWLKDPGC